MSLELFYLQALRDFVVVFALFSDNPTFVVMSRIIRPQFYARNPFSRVFCWLRNYLYFNRSSNERPSHVLLFQHKHTEFTPGFRKRHKRRQTAVRDGAALRIVYKIVLLRVCPNFVYPRPTDIFLNFERFHPILSITSYRHKIRAKLEMCDCLASSPTRKSAV